jgi:hypothetical protein
MAAVERRSIPRTRLQVVHRHRVRGEPVRRISELLFIEGRPVAVLDWTEKGGVRRPRQVIALETARLRRSQRVKTLFRYEGVTGEGP